MRPGEAVRRLDDALPQAVDFSIGHGGAPELQWSVVVRQRDRGTGRDDYRRVSAGTDLGAVVDEAIGLYRQWLETAAKPSKPSKLSAPGAADRRDRKRPRKDAS